MSPERRRDGVEVLHLDQVRSSLEPILHAKPLSFPVSAIEEAEEIGFASSIWD
jgi:hypothetical protein